jgi:hypothetical protein
MTWRRKGHACTFGKGGEGIVTSEDPSGRKVLARGPVRQKKL